MSVRSGRKGDNLLNNRLNYLPSLCARVPPLQSYSANLLEDAVIDFSGGLLWMPEEFLDLTAGELVCGRLTEKSQLFSGGRPCGSRRMKHMLYAAVELILKD